jgi:pimeloyl-ACP methyl ester carboxylesterase
MPKIKVNDIYLDYERVGSGENLLFLHGLGSTKQDWDAQVPIFSKHYHVITVDLRGHGQTDKPADGYGVPYMTQDIKGLIDALKIKKVSLIGFSMGGAVAFDFAAKHPEYLKNLVIVNSSPDFNNLGQVGEDLLRNRTAFLETKGLPLLAAEIAFNMFPEEHQTSMRQEFEDRCKQNDYNAYYKSFTTLMGWGLGEKLKNIEARTLVVAADMDYTPVSLKQAYVDRMHNAELAVIKNARHGVVIDQADAFNSVLLKFLSNE